MQVSCHVSDPPFIVVLTSTDPLSHKQIVADTAHEKLYVLKQLGSLTDHVGSASLHVKATAFSVSLGGHSDTFAGGSLYNSDLFLFGPRIDGFVR
jgi:hypothetical protein